MKQPLIVSDEREKQTLETSMTLPFQSSLEWQEWNDPTKQNIFRYKEMFIRIIWDRKNISKSGWSHRHWGTFSQCPQLSEVQMPPPGPVKL